MRIDSSLLSSRKNSKKVLMICGRLSSRLFWTRRSRRFLVFSWSGPDTVERISRCSSFLKDVLVTKLRKTSFCLDRLLDEVVDVL